MKCSCGLLEKKNGGHSYKVVCCKEERLQSGMEKAKCGGDICLNGFDISLTEIRKLF